MTNLALTLLQMPATSQITGIDWVVIAIYFSNRALDLTPVTRAIAIKYQLTFTHIGVFNGPDWVLLCRNGKILRDPVLYRPFPDLDDPPLLWTDDYSNLLSVLKR